MVVTEKIILELTRQEAQTLVESIDKVWDEVHSSEHLGPILELSDLLEKEVLKR